MDSNEPQQSAVGEPAGQQLKRARESHGLSLKDIADAQHLRVSVIQAIEDGNYNEIDSELFLKGYVRAYAKHVGANANALIESLDQELEPTRRERVLQEQENPLIDIERRRRKKRQLAKAFGVIIVLGAIALAAWKLVLEPRMGSDVAAAAGQAENAEAPVSVEENHETAENSVSEPGPEADMTEADASPGAGAEQGSAIVSSSEPSTGVEPRDSAEPLDNGGAMESPAVADVSGNAQGADSSMEDARSESAGDSAGGNAVSDMQANEAAAAEPVVQPAPVFEESAQPQAVAASTRLEMSFVSDCWVQVTDSSGARLVASLQRNGDRINVSGRAPLDIVIGAVDAVDTVRFGGDPVNLSNFRVVNNRTEFTLTL